MGANPFVVSTLSINSCFILTEGLCLRLDTIAWSVGEGGFGRFGDFAVLVSTAGLYCGDLTVDFLFAVGDTDLLFLRPTLIHAESFGCPVPLGVGFFVRVGLAERGGKSSLLMLFHCFFFTIVNPYVGRYLTKI